MKILRPKYKLTKRSYYVFITLILLMMLAYFDYKFTFIAMPALWLTIILVFADFMLLLLGGKAVNTKRHLNKLFSNGDHNPVTIEISNNYNFKIKAQIIDELPPELQIRDFSLQLRLNEFDVKTLEYTVRPVKRGEYNFGNIVTLVTSPLGLIYRVFISKVAQTVKVYPSFVKLPELALKSFADINSINGFRPIRSMGYNMEFEQIKEYVPGDEIRHINWKATARKNKLMVNEFQEEKAQHVYCVIDMGRTMEMPFEGMSLLDYAVNASLALSQVILKNNDKAGLITFNKELHTIVKADNRQNHLNTIMENLYLLKTDFHESFPEAIYPAIRRNLTGRSLLLFFVNYESVYALKRQLPFFTALGRRHLLVLVNFVNTEVKNTAISESKDIEGIYRKTIAGEFLREKEVFLQNLMHYGIYYVMETPDNIGVHTINKYLEIKARGLL